MKSMYWLALTLVIIGALNWGLVGLFSFDLVATILGEGSFLSRTVYTLVGLSALVVAARHLASQGSMQPVHAK